MKRVASDLVTLEREIGAPLAEVRFRRGVLDLPVLHVPDQDDLWHEAIDLDRPPYWATLWPAALGLARWLADGAALGTGLPPAPTLEIGCGVGLPGVVAAWLGSPVTQTDYETRALRLAMANADAAGLPVDAIEYRVADWRAWPLATRFPRMIAADVLYEAALHPALRDVLDAALLGGGEALLADPGRPPALTFAAELERDGWRVEIEDLPRQDGEPNLFLYRCYNRSAW